MTLIRTLITAVNNCLFTLTWPLPFAVISLVVAVLCSVCFFIKRLSSLGSLTGWLFGVSIFWILRFEGFILYLIFNILGNIKRKNIKTDYTAVLSSLPVVLMVFCWHFSSDPKFIVAFGAALSEYISDRWATDFGKMWPKKPLSLKNFRPVEKGTAGAVSPLGCISSVSGAALCSFLWSALFGLTEGWTVIMLCGFFGSTVDSVLGTFCQAIYKDGEGNLYEESAGELVRGVRWLDNNCVDFISCLCAALLAFVLA